MRVYLLTPSFPPTLGGQERHLLELATTLTEAGACASVLTRRALRGVAPRETIQGVNVRRFAPTGAIKGVGIAAAPRLGILLLRIMWRLWRDRRHYDVVLVSGFNFMPFAPVVTGLLTRKPCVVRPESPLEVGAGVGAEARQKMRLASNSMLLRWFDRLRLAAALRVDRYVAISSEIRAGLLRAGIAEQRIVTIPNGIDVAKFTPADGASKARLRAALGLPAHALLVTYTGRLAVSKGVMLLIEAWQALAPGRPDAHLVLVGSGAGCFDDCEPALREFIDRNHLAKRVTLTGTVANVEAYLKASDVFAFASEYEGFSLSILEAMTAGLPMVCTRVGIASDLAAVRAAPIGLLVEPKDADAFQQALARLLDDAPLRAVLGEHASAAVRAEYSLQSEARRYLDLFAGLSAPPA